MRLAMGKQVGNAIKLIDQGLKLEKVDDTTQKLRIIICQTCPRFEPESRQCLECGCPMDYKTSLAKNPMVQATGETDEDKIKMRCPLRKW